MKPTERFTDRVENYVKYRPDYPKEMIRYFMAELGLNESSVVADIGSGTGISAREFLSIGCEVFGVEPNEAMRMAGTTFLADNEKFHSIAATAEETTLPDASMDLVTASQAFHWFDQTAAKREFLRILKPGGTIALIWNVREVDANEFHVELERFLLDLANDYTKVRHENVGELQLENFFGGKFTTKTLDHSQTFDLDGLRGRIKSSSYMPAEGSERYEEMLIKLDRLFANYQENGKIHLLYRTKIYHKQY